MLASVVFGIACMLMPIIAWGIINDTWETGPIPLIGIIYRPWRFFLVAIGLPSLVCALVLLPIPESPKFILSMGKQSDAIAVLRWMHAANGGSRSEMPAIQRISEEAESVALRQRREQFKGSSCGSVFSSMWSQTTPLFSGIYLRTTLLASALQFGNYVNTNGMYMWFPDTVNRVIDYTHRNPDTSATVCQILRWSSTTTAAAVTAAAAHTTTALEITNGLSVWTLNGTGATVSATLVDGASSALPSLCGSNGAMESEAFTYTFLLELLYAVGFALMALIIAHVGKCAILGTVTNELCKTQFPK